MTKVVDKRKLPIYIDSELDDLGLDPYTFRIYARLARRAAGNGESYESVANMATFCQMSERQVKRALKLLVDCRIIARTSRPGETSIYQLNDRTCWEVGSPQARPWASTNLGRCEPGSLQAWVPGSPQAHKGTPIEGEVIKEPPYIPPSGGTVKAESGFKVEQNFEPEEVSEPATTTQTPPPSKTSGQTLKAKRSAAATRRAKKAIKAAATNPQHNPTQFEAWWMIFRGHAQRANLRPGDRAEAVAAWDVLHEISQSLGQDLSELAAAILDGTEYYWQREKLRTNPSVKNGCRFLAKRDWEEATEWHNLLEASSALAAPQSLAPFLACWNQDRPTTWPVADPDDLDQDLTRQLERFIGSCPNSLERFQKALLWVRRDEYWGLQRVLTLKEFLYSTRINEWSKKQIHHEALGIGDRVGGLAEAAKNAKREAELNQILKEMQEDDARKQQAASNAANSRTGEALWHSTRASSLQGISELLPSQL